MPLKEYEPGTTFPGMIGRTVAPLIVASELGSDAEEVAVRALAMHLRDAGVDEGTPGVEPRVALAESISEGVLQTCGDCDLIVFPGAILFVLLVIG